MEPISGADTLKLRGRHVALDFVNTVDPRAGAENREYLQTYGDLTAWGRHVGLLTEERARRLLRAAREEPAEADRVLHRAVALREALYRLFSGTSTAASREADLETVGREVRGAFGKARIETAGAGFTWDWDSDEADLEAVVSQIARAAAELMTSGDLDRVRECASDDCGWLFLDASKNRGRRWCSMEGCGNRAKARRHYARARGT